MARQKPKKKLDNRGRVYIHATFNNTLVTITDGIGKPVLWGSAGTAGFKGTRKSTPFAATTSVRQVAEKAKYAGLRSVDIFVKGPGLGRDAAIRALKSVGFKITSIADITPIPHNGCRPKKRRRV